jgi:N-acetylmuramoyl-L-alanine amidase
VGRQAEQGTGAWETALRARAQFEALPQGTHSRADYSRAMDGFRSIYHDDPSDAHAARAVQQVAELLAEEGRELNDRKSLRDAAGQYEFLAKAYPGTGLAAVALGEALELLGPGAADDSAEALGVRAEIEEDYPRSAAARAAREDGGMPRTAPAMQRPAPIVREAADSAAAHLSDDGAVAKMRQPVQAAEAGPVATVTGIRHWSTATYTRVAIDLAVDSEDGVKYEAARVENPDRIYFDLHHARLAPQLAGKSFNVTDDGFLTKIRAAQFSDDVTRVVLDVHQVAEYSAFLLPNPYRLIIDIHGKAGNREQGIGNSEQAAANGAAPTSSEQRTAKVMPPAMTSNEAVENSSLPPMPVTDGSAAFGLPPTQAASGGGGADGAGLRSVARSRVVVSSKPTAAKPVPNTVTTRSSETGAQFGTEVADVSNQPGRVEATSRPTSQPIVSKSGEKLAAKGEQPGVGRDNFRPRPGRGSGAAPNRRDDVAGPSPSQNRNGGHSASAAPVEALNAVPAEPAPPTADGETSLVRALGLKIGRIVIDAGHGGHDSGTLGVGGIEEKDVVLDVALRLGKLLHDRLGAQIVYTRADDTFIPLETRTAIANKAQADLFISIHANSSSDPSARGVEVYYLNFTSDPDAMRVAARENAVSTESVHELSDLVKQIALKDKIDESRELASDVDTSLFAGLTKGNPGLKNRGVKKAPFVVLIGANMPSILAEISFVTNPTDAEKLEEPVYRERVAESLYAGVARYAEGINGGGSKATVRTTEQAER